MECAVAGDLLWLLFLTDVSSGRRVEFQQEEVSMVVA